MAAIDARDDAVRRGTSAKQVRAWSGWQKILQSIDMNNDEYMDNLRPTQRVYIISAFAHTVRSAEYSKSKISRLGEESVRNSVDHVAQTFRCSQRPDPRLDTDGKPSRLLQLQYKGYKAEDPAPKQQKALPGIVLKQLYRIRSTERSKAISDLCTGAYFFAMRSCEYLAVTGPKRKTKRLRLRNIRFFK